MLNKPFFYFYLLLFFDIDAVVENTILLGSFLLFA